MYELYDYENDEDSDLKMTAEAEQEDSVITAGEQEFADNITEPNFMTTTNYDDSTYISLLNLTSYCTIYKNRQYKGILQLSLI